MKGTSSKRANSGFWDIMRFERVFYRKKNGNFRIDFDDAYTRPTLLFYSSDEVKRSSRAAVTLLFILLDMK